MPYISGKQMIQQAWKGGYAIGAFSVHNAETIRAVLLAAKEERAPVMVQIGQRVINTLGLLPMKAMVDAFMAECDVPVCIHLDHSRSFEQTMEAVRAGFHSVMFDGSHLSFDENVRITRAVADVSHALGVGCEGEIGKIGGTEDDISVDEKDAFITSCEETLSFSQGTTVDYLAVSIGTAHGIYKQEPKLAFGRLAEIRDAVKKPIVLHGGSGVPDEQIRKAVELGVAKVNVDTELRQAFTEGVLDVLGHDPHEYTLALSLGRGTDFMKERVKEKIRLFGSHNRAADF
ncbi:D-tagatose-1,6-bisphosphate aldolase subunit KbaY [Leminorella richardii]|uniref:D-tagatose-1,6-bisphosphate aldolase subunit KbaY n=2 Tax=Leminorella richardii TaxID=158841 RepID=A0A2X4U9V5_9GAMM|nr:class II fructose-bisphosphate aldolase [Leminorella richardii]SQI36597.1 D-tagatose-1,6-bisphosphate aldolase subunit KbaY [Leminorella richardii]